VNDEINVTAVAIVTVLWQENPQTRRKPLSPDRNVP
jgi:hypothetical protein